MGARWTDTDDATIRLFPPAEAAAILGRTLDSIYTRRSEIDAGYAHADRKTRKRLRREFFQATSQGARDEVSPPPERPACRYCTRTTLHARGLCKRCYRCVQRMVESGYVTWEIAERCWLGGSR